MSVRENLNGHDAGNGGYSQGDTYRIDSGFLTGEMVHRIVRIRLLIAKRRAAYELSDDAGTSRDTHLEHDKP